MGCAFVYSSKLAANIDFWHLVMMRSAQTAALAFLFVPISTIAYATLPRELNGDATALFTMLRNVFGSIGISVSTAIVANYQQVNQLSLIANLTPTNQPYEVLLRQVEQALVNTGHSMGQAMQMAPGQVLGMLQSQVAVLSYIDVFFITACMAFVMIPTALLMSGAKPQGGGGMH